MHVLFYLEYMLPIMGMSLMGVGSHVGNEHGHERRRKSGPELCACLHLPRYHARTCILWELPLRAG